jgi:hypothetical protein
LFKDKTKASCEIKVRIKDQKTEYYRIDGIMQADLEKEQLARLTFTNIHKEKEHEIKLQFNSQLFENIEEAIIAIDSFGYINYINKKAEDFARNFKKDALAKHIDDVLKIFNPKNEEQEYVPLDFVMDSIDQKAIIAKCVNAANEEFFLELTCSTHISNGKTTGYLIFLRDKTEEHTVQVLYDMRMQLISYSTMHTLDELLVKALDEIERITNSKIAFYHFVNSNEQIIKLQEWSTQTKQVFCKAEAKGMNYKLSDAGIWADAMRQKEVVIHNNYPKIKNKKGLPNGHAPIFREMVAPVIRDNKVVAMLGVGNKKGDYTKLDASRLAYIADVTWEIIQQKKTSEELKGNKRFLENVFNAIQDGISVISPDLKVIATNSWMQNKFGVKESLIGLSCYKSLRSKQSVCEGCPVKVTLKSKTKTTRVLAYEKENGSNGWLEITAFPILNDQNKVVQVIEYQKDITLQKQALEDLEQSNLELHQAKEKAEESDRLKSSFLANMSHEIRTPMNGILGFAELLKEPDITDLEHNKFLGIIEKSGERMLNIINDLIDISKIESKLMEVIYSSVDINKQMEYLYGFFKPETDKKGLILNYQAGSPNDEAFFETDKDKFMAIFINLIKNAVKYTKNGEITFGYRIENDTIIFFVKDTGLGIPKAAQAKVFDRFVQADLALTSEYEGAGLGLAISKGYLDLLGGNIHLESKYRKGSTFTFTLPYVKAKNKVKSKITHPSKNTNLELLHILIVDDDQITLEYLSTLFKAQVKSISIAKNGQDAVNIAKEKKELDVILIDVKMPVKDGYQATREIRLFNKKVKIIAHTAFNIEGEKNKALEAGCDYFISKPAKKKELIDLLTKINQ